MIHSKLLGRDLDLQPVVLTGALVVAATWWWLRFKKRENLPPSPFIRIPVVGNLLQLMRIKIPMYEYFYELSKTEKFKKVFTIHMGCHRTIVLNHVDVVHEALVQRQNDYASRPSFYSLDKMTWGGKDILAGQYNDTWKMHRKVSHSAIRNYAAGESLERSVDEALSITIAALEKEIAKNVPFNIKPHLVLLIMNVLAAVTFGKTYDLEDEVLKDFVDVTRESLEAFGNGLPADFLPFLKYLPTSSSEKRMDEIMDRYFKFLGKHWEDHIEKRKAGKTDPDDLIDYLLWQHEVNEKDNAATKGVLSDAHLFMTVFDVFGAGIDTMVTTLHYFIAHVMMNPEVEASIMNEIEENIGSGPVLLSHRAKLPYTEACLKESLRKGGLATLGFPLMTTCDTKIDKYDVPKGTSVMINFWALHNDPGQWEEPNAFRPERFLDANGNLGPKPPSYFPFSGGRRVCLGEGLSKSALMMIIPKFYQRLQFSSPLGDKFKLEFDDSSSLAILPKPYDVLISRRN